jgi:hypothetical protein
MPPQLTVKAPGKRRRSGHSCSSSSKGRDNRVSQEAGYLLQLQISRSQREQDADSPYRPKIKPTDAVGTQFRQFHVPDRDFLVRQPLPPTSRQLFQLFLPEQLVEQWARYTNEAPEPASAAAEGNRQSKWIPTSTAEMYMWLGILIYMSYIGKNAMRMIRRHLEQIDGSLIIRSGISCPMIVF